MRAPKNREMTTHTTHVLGCEVASIKDCSRVSTSSCDRRAFQHKLLCGVAVLFRILLVLVAEGLTQRAECIHPGFAVTQRSHKETKAESYASYALRSSSFVCTDLARYNNPEPSDALVVAAKITAPEGEKGESVRGFGEAMTSCLRHRPSFRSRHFRYSSIS